MTLTICERCGRVAELGALAGHCTVCAPPRDVLEASQRVVDARHREARQDAAEGLIVPQRRPTEPPKRARLVAHWRVVSDRAIPHLFSPGMAVTRSLCGSAFDRGRSYTPLPGERGCRRCALVAGWIESLSDVVTT